MPVAGSQITCGLYSIYIYIIFASQIVIFVFFFWFDSVRGVFILDRFEPQCLFRQLLLLSLCIIEVGFILSEGQRLVVGTSVFGRLSTSILSK